MWWTKVRCCQTCRGVSEWPYKGVIACSCFITAFNGKADEMDSLQKHWDNDRIFKLF